ncbi:hypothetical protein AAG570_011161 [Ranatra chinensis]|uniref:Brinker DNA-binding domain-containing protein n=1 Tax=Ranatra chinensis TaxID=642074 RepID=A0ABD0YK24_9HEMI
MAHGVREHWRRATNGKSSKGMGSRRIFSPQFKLRVLDSYRRDSDCRGNQRATARKYGIHRRQIQKWLQMENALRSSSTEGGSPEPVALNLASARQRDDGSPCSAGSIPAPAPPPQPSEDVNVDKISDSEDDLSSEESLYEQDRALDFTCAALSKRRFFPVGFKLGVVDAFYADPDCRGNQRATARKFGVHRRQVQKWLDRENALRGSETLQKVTECLDLSKKRKLEEEETDWTVSKRIDVQDEQETALCLVKQPAEVTAPVDLYRPYLCCHQSPETPPIYDTSPWSPPHYYPYYGVIDTSYVTKWLSHDAPYYRQTVHDVGLYAPMYS